MSKPLLISMYYYCLLLVIANFILKYDIEVTSFHITHNNYHRIKRSTYNILYPSSSSSSSSRKRSIQYLLTKGEHINDEIDNTNKNKRSNIKVAVVGCGAVGSYYGGRLWESSLNVKFLMRGEHLQACQQSGLHITSIHGDMHIPYSNETMYESSTSIGPVDWIIVSLKSYSLDDIPNLIQPLLKKSTRVLFIMNGLIDEQLVHLLTDGGNNELPCKAVYGGMAFICSNRIAPGKVDHSYAGALTCGLSVSRTTSLQNTKEDSLAIDELWSNTKVEYIYESLLIRGRWIKNCWNLPFNGLSVAMGCITVDKIVSDVGLRELADKIMDDTILIANQELKERGVHEEDLLGDAIKMKLWALTDVMGPYKTSTMLDVLHNKPMEVRYLFTEPLLRATRYNVSSSVPTLKAIVTQVEAIQRLRNLN